MIWYNSSPKVYNAILVNMEISTKVEAYQFVEVGSKSPRALTPNNFYTVTLIRVFAYQMWNLRIFFDGIVNSNITKYS